MIYIDEYKIFYQKHINFLMILIKCAKFVRKLSGVRTVQMYYTRKYFINKIYIYIYNAFLHTYES